MVKPIGVVIQEISNMYSRDIGRVAKTIETVHQETESPICQKIQLKCVRSLNIQHGHWGLTRGLDAGLNAQNAPLDASSFVPEVIYLEFCCVVEWPVALSNRAILGAIIYCIIQDGYTTFSRDEAMLQRQETWQKQETIFLCPIIEIQLTQISPIE